MELRGKCSRALIIVLVLMRTVPPGTFGQQASAHAALVSFRKATDAPLYIRQWGKGIRLVRYRLGRFEMGEKTRAWAKKGIAEKHKEFRQFHAAVTLPRLSGIKVRNWP